MMATEVTNARVSMDEGDFFWTADVVLANVEDRTIYPVNAPVVLSVQGEDFKLVVDSRTIEKTGVGDYTVRLSCVSPSVQLVAPRALPITKTWNTTTTAKTIAQEVVGAYAMQWEILDWPITPNLFAVADQYPLDIVRTLAEVVGGTVDTLPNGNVRVRYLFPTAVTSYGPGTKDHLFTEQDDVLSGTEGLQPTKVYNRFRLMNSESPEGADRLEFTQSEERDDEGVVRAYPSPWRTTFTLDTTRENVFIAPGEYEEREETETIEIVNGKGNVRYPVLSVTSIDFLDLDLVGVSFKVGGTEITTTSTDNFYSLLKIVYKVRSIAYSVRGVAGEQAQFLMKEV